MPNHMTPSLEEESLWLNLPDSVLLHVFQFLTPTLLTQCMQVCKSWHRVACDEFLWKDLFYTQWKIDRSIPMAPGKTSWYSEYKRLFYKTPQIESECLEEHRDQVLHVSFSHAGDLFATSSKDGYVKVWNATNPVSLKYCADMKKYTWKYTQFTQFNSTDTLLLVSGVHFGWQSTSGEIAVFNLVDGFELQCRVLNKPYDIFGTWYNDNYLLSGNLYWMGQLQSSSVLWLNKAYQDLESELESVVMRLYKFKNINASSIRTIMVADCLGSDSPDPAPSTSASASRSHGTGSRSQSSPPPPPRVKVVSKDGTIKYNADYHQVQKSSHQHSSSSFSDDDDVDVDVDDDEDMEEAKGWTQHPDASSRRRHRHRVPASDAAESYTYVSAPPQQLQHSDSDSDATHSSSSCDSSTSSDNDNDDDDDGDDAADDVADDFSPSSSSSFPRRRRRRRREIPAHGKPCYLGNRIPVTPGGRNLGDGQRRDKYLVFTMGMKTYTPHQIGIKRIRWEHAKQKMHEKTPGPAFTPEEARQMRDHPEALEAEVSDGSFDDVDQLIEMNGHIIGMALSPDHRYLYVNSRPWPKDAVIANPLTPPPIAQEIDIHVVDIVTMRQVGLMHRSHKAYTSDDECFFIFLDVCNEYVASGAEDKHGYLWDRHYGVCLTKYAHTDVVNAVAFSPRDPETLVTVSDDHHFKVWRSRNRVREAKMAAGVTGGAGAGAGVGVGPGVGAGAEAGAMGGVDREHESKSSPEMPTSWHR